MRRHKADRFTCFSGASCAACTVDIAFLLKGNIIVDNMRDAVDIDASCRYICGDQIAEFSAFEVIHYSETIFLHHTAVQFITGIIMLFKLLHHKIDIIFSPAENDAAVRIFNDGHITQ